MAGGLVFGAVSPHPPLLIPEIGGADLRQIDATVRGMQAMARQLAATGPETIVVISPHSPSYADAMGIATAARLEGDFGAFRAPNVRMQFEVDQELGVAIQSQAQSRDLPLTSTSQPYASSGLDWGVMVPMYYIHQALPGDVPLVSLSFSRLPYAEHFAFGHAIRSAAEDTGRRVAVVASGDLSHRLIPEAPAGYDPMAKAFDEQLVEAVRHSDVEAMLGMDPVLISRAGECGMRSIVVLFGALDGLDARPEVLSYEGPFGVGYMVASFAVPEPAGKQE